MLGRTASVAAVTLVVMMGLSGTPASALDNRDVLYASCKKDLKLSDSGCECLMGKIEKELNGKQQTFLTAAISKNTQGMMKAQGELTGNEMMHVTQFMSQAPSQCQ